MSGQARPLFQGQMMMGAGNYGSNWFGSMPLYVADTNAFKPNFRHFDFFIEDFPPDRDIIERVYKCDNDAHWMNRIMWGMNIRAIPLIVKGVVYGFFSHNMSCRLQNKPGAYSKGTLPGHMLMMFLWQNFQTWFFRERQFRTDFQRNQWWAYEELRRERDMQRVREGLYTLQFVDDPMLEYRIKEWQTAERFD
jgi:hypothetical protein